MVKHLTAHGNSTALIIDKAILDILRINIKTPLELSTDGKSLIVSPVGSFKRARAFQTALEKVNKAHGKTLKKLSE